MAKKLKMKMMYEGKAKKIYSSTKANQVVVYYKDDATALNGLKKDSISNKGVLNNQITSIIFTMLNDKKIPTHFIKRINDREQLCKKVTIIPLEVIVRNLAAGSMAKRLGLKEGYPLKTTVYELSYKDDSLGDPLINDHHAVGIGAATFKELKVIYALTEKINKILITFFKKLGIILIDFKLEFGKLANGKIILADEISPDTCRFWDAKTKEKLDKDRFRRNMGKVEDAYKEILKRISK